MKWLMAFWRGDPEGLKHAKEADAEATLNLKVAQENSEIAQRLLRQNHLTSHFFNTLRQGGHA